ncbi:TetR family transcriptional regulator [Mycobacteroides abscessus subsp. abscessus]|nr:TetR family transcriptional regulator [Mycobacteroides abscessus subsp. abscessus]
MPGTDRLSESELITLVFMITDMFDGEALVKTLRPYPELVAGRDELLAKLLRGYRPDA